MANPYQPIEAQILKTIDETPTIRTFVLKPEQDVPFLAGQFVELTVPGHGEAPFTPSSSHFERETIEVTIMKVGRATTALFGLKAGDSVGIRGPYGQRYPLESFEGKDIYLVGGGVGLAPLRSLFLSLVHEIDKYRRVFLRYGARTPEEIVYKYLIPQWEKLKKVDIDLSVDVGDKSWVRKVGVVTCLMDDIPCDETSSIAVVCGPPVMMKFVTFKLVDAGFKPENIYLSMETNMSCGLGQCGHCRLGPYFTCKDGPVLTWEQIKDIPEPFV
ncbi:MAG: FAD/NAD(P)-binding protein [candidate division WOR-3 bacterium]|nr:MAG: FAD/NAD(P)-binding protein [candidate division WOR-3 bacterium]